MPSGGFWRKPVTRMYSYNLDLGEHYYSPMTTYLDTERGTRGETPGALTFSERLARKWVTGRRYEATELRDRYARSSSMAREATQASTREASQARESTVARGARAVSEIPTAPRPSYTSAWLNRRQMAEQASASSAVAQTEKKTVRIESTQAKSTQQQGSSTTVKHSTECHCGCDESMASATSKTALMAKQKMEDQRKAFLSGYSSSSQQKAVRSREEEFKYKVSEKQTDDVNKRIADIRMQPWMNRSDMQEAEEASSRARARIVELERELEEITKKALMSSSKSLKSAKQMAYQATMEADEEAKASSTKKTKKVMIQSSRQIRG